MRTRLKAPPKRCGKPQYTVHIALALLLLCDRRPLLPLYPHLDSPATTPLLPSFSVSQTDATGPGSMNGTEKIGLENRAESILSGPRTNDHGPGYGTTGYMANNPSTETVSYHQ